MARKGDPNREILASNLLDKKLEKSKRQEALGVYDKVLEAFEKAHPDNPNRLRNLSSELLKLHFSGKIELHNNSISEICEALGIDPKILDKETPETATVSLTGITAPPRSVRTPKPR